MKTNHNTQSESIPIPIPTPTPMGTGSRRIANNRLQAAAKLRLSAGGTGNWLCRWPKAKRVNHSGQEPFS
jgi:hypothetical protein